MEIKRSIRVSGGPTRHHAYRLVRAAIETAEFEPGQRLSENELAERLGVSRTPIREALMSLRDDRLVEIVPQFGTFVTHITRVALEDAQFVREALECAAVIAAARAASDEDVDALRAIVTRQSQTRDKNDLNHFYMLDDEFHASLCELGGHGIAWSISQRASGHLNRVRHLSLPLPDYIPEMVDQHSAVVDAIGARDPARAEAALREHLSQVLSGLAAVGANHPEYFETDADRDWALELSKAR
ncbi:MAG: GntR family transcriptional regulator [Solirubrobacterales bacterium]|nr:GntR family transcriptional regulator [Solirubrobacterales bacterium]